MNVPTDENGNISIDDFYNAVEQMIINMRENRAGTPPVSRDSVIDALPASSNTPTPTFQGQGRPTDMRRVFRF